MTINLLDPSHYQESVIKFIDLRPDKELKEQLDDAYQRMMSVGQFIGGYEVEAFEEEWATYIGAKYCVACGNGFDALVLALKAHGIGPNCQVSVPTETCLPTWAAVEDTGALVRPDDIDIYRNEFVEAVMPVHLYGIPAEIQYPLGSAVIEDAAQAHGSLYPDRTKVGSKNTTAWSFYPTKNLGCYGDGGAVTTNHGHIASYIRQLRDYGSNFVRSGINSRLDTLQAAFLRVKLSKLDKYNARRREIADKYMDGIHWIDGGDAPITPHPYFSPRLLKSDEEYKLTNFHQFVVETDRRDDLKSYLHDNGVQTMIHYEKPPHQHACFSVYKNRYPYTDDWSKTVLSLPIAPHLTDEQVEYIIALVNEWTDKQ